MATTVTDQIRGITISESIKAPVKAIATGNITLSGEQTVSGTAVVDGDRVLCIAQTSGVDNGIYDVSTGTWQRSPDFDGNDDVLQGTLIQKGTGSGIFYRITTANPIVIGTTSLAFEAVSSTLTQADVALLLNIRTANEIAASVTPVTYVIPSHDQIGSVVVDREGENTTQGTTNMYTGIRNALAVARTGTNVSGIGDHSALEFLAGTYAISTNNPFNDGTTLERGMVIKGQGMASSVLKLITGGSDKYFYYNGSASTQNYIFMTYEDLMFTADSTTYGKGFYFQQDQGYRFNRCWFYNLARVLEGNGNDTGSEHKFSNCKITDIYDRVISFDNNQMLNISLTDCDVETIYGHIFYVDDGAGGALTVRGGSYIMDAVSSDKYLLYINGAGQGGNTNRFTFNDIQTEFHTVYCKLVYKGNSDTNLRVTFNDCNLSNTTGGTRVLVDITGGRVTFNRCSLPAADTYTIQTGLAGITSQRHGDPGTLIFNECIIPSNFSALITTGNYGYARARGCYNNEYTSSTGTCEKEAYDFDLNWNNGGRASNFPGVKSISVKNTLGDWPYTGDGDANDWRVLLPVGALIKSIKVYRPANGSGGAGNVQLAVGTGDKGTTYGSSTLAAGTSAHVISLEYDIDAMINCGSVTNTRQVRLWGSTKNTSVVTGGYFVVEYY